MAISYSPPAYTADGGPTNATAPSLDKSEAQVNNQAGTAAANQTGNNNASLVGAAAQNQFGLTSQLNANQNALSQVGGYNGTLNGLTLAQATGQNTLQAGQNNNQIGLDKDTLQYLSQLGGIQSTNNDQTVAALNALLGNYQQDQGYTTQQTASQVGNAQNQEAQDILANTQAKSKEKSSEIASGGYGAAGYNQDLGAYDQQAGLLGQNLQYSLQGINAQGNLNQNNISEQIQRFVNMPLSNQQAQYAQQQADNTLSGQKATGDITQQNLANMLLATQNQGLSNQYSTAASNQAQKNALNTQQMNLQNGQALLNAYYTAMANQQQAGG